mmetsp:Transcript_7730/g.11991  ORF Transcript_7730/g.11991 Transcript_7730/m.11991 type:complete len:100 (-) Transcript_7730:1054-1353(-)
MIISSKIKVDIQNSEALKDKIEHLNSKNREQLKSNIQQERNINTMKVTNKSLEQRLTQAQTKIEELNAVKQDHDQLQQKFTVTKNQLEALNKDIEIYKK